MTHNSICGIVELIFGFKILKFNQTENKRTESIECEKRLTKMQVCAPFLKHRPAWALAGFGVRRSFASRPARRVLLPAPGPPSSFVNETVEPGSSETVLGDREVEVQVAACAVAYRDIIDRTGGCPFMNQPTVLGHEFSGRVTRAGASSSLQEGDRVVSLHWAQYDQEAWPAPFGHKDAMKTFLGLTCDGGYQDYVTTHETAFVKVPNPKFLTGVEAAPAMSTFGTVWQGAVVRGGLRRNERVLVTGAAGGVGSAAVCMAARLGAHVIGTTGSVDAKQEYIKSLGAAEVISAEKGFSKQLGRGNLVDMVIENVGAPTFTDSLRSLKPGGRLVLIGNVTNEAVSLPLGLCILNSLSVIGTDSIEGSELEKMFLWMEKEGLKPSIDHVLPLEQAAKAHEMIEERAVNGRIVLDVNSSIW